MAQGALRIGVRMHGVTLTLESQHAPLLDHALEHLKPLITEPDPSPDIYVRCAWSEGEWDPARNPFAADGDLNIVGNRMLGRPGELVWLDTLRKKGLQLRFRRDDSSFIFDAAYRLHQKERVDGLANYDQKKYFGLMHELVYFPLIWYLERHRRLTLVHAAALDTADGGVMICGLGGVGKSTTCAALMVHAGARLLSENLVLTDGDLVYACPEPVRLDAGSLDMLGSRPPQLIEMPFPEGIKEKTCFHLSDGNSSEKVKPVALFIPQFSSDRRMTRLEPELAAAKIAAMNSLVREIDEYRWYAAALDITWPDVGGARRAAENLERLTRNAACYELSIDRSSGVEAVVGDIIGAVREIRSHSLLETRR
jgi:hypothetical protein